MISAVINTAGVQNHSLVFRDCESNHSALPLHTHEDGQTGTQAMADVNEGVRKLGPSCVASGMSGGTATWKKMSK